MIHNLALVLATAAASATSTCNFAPIHMYILTCIYSYSRMYTYAYAWTCSHMQPSSSRHLRVIADNLDAACLIKVPRTAPADRDQNGCVGVIYACTHVCLCGGVGVRGRKAVFV